MTKSISLLSLIVLVTLSACGGGSSGGGGTPVPVVTMTPAPIIKSVSFSWTGAMAPPRSTIQAATRHPASSPSATPVPVMEAMCDPQVEDCTGYHSQLFGPDVQAKVTASEAGVTPQSQPSLAATNGLYVGAPVPAPSATPVYPVPVGPAPNPSSYTLTATFPDHTTGTIPVYVYKHVTVGCGTARDGTQFHPGYDFDADAPAADLAHSTIYITSASCPAPFTDANQAYTLHMSNGASSVTLSDVQSFANLAPGQWSNSVTSTDVQSYINAVTATGSANQGLTMFKTASGSIVKFQMTQGLDSTGQTYISGSYWIAVGGANFTQ